MEKIIVNPNMVRGAGNVVETKTGADYTCYKSDLTIDTDTVNGVSTSVCILEYDDTEQEVTSITLTASASTFHVGEGTLIKASLSDPVSGVSVSFHKGEASHLTTITSNYAGEANYLFNPSDIGEYTITATCNGVSSSGLTVECVQQGTVIVVGD